MAGVDGVQFADAQYIALTSFKRDGSPVATPVWVVRDGDALAVWTPRKTYKVRRIERNPAVTVAPCTFSGRPLGSAATGRAEIMDSAGRERVRRAIKRKYGVTGWLSVVGSRVRRGVEGTVAIRIELDPEAERPEADGSEADGSEASGSGAADGPATH